MTKRNKILTTKSQHAAVVPETLYQTAATTQKKIEALGDHVKKESQLKVCTPHENSFSIIANPFAVIAHNYTLFSTLNREILNIYRLYSPLTTRITFRLQIVNS